MSTAAYDCSKCPGYCCSYPVIKLNERDVTRLARHFEIDVEAARAKFTKAAHGEAQIMRRRKDEHFGKICMLFDRKARRCTAYKARPGVCRRFPAEERCGYWDFLAFERHHQEDPAFVATTDNGAWE